MKKRLYEALEREDLCQLKLPLDRRDSGSLASYSPSEEESSSSTFCQSDFLTHDQPNQRLIYENDSKKSDRSFAQKKSMDPKNVKRSLTIFLS